MSGILQQLKQCLPSFAVKWLKRNRFLYGYYTNQINNKRWSNLIAQPNKLLREYHKASDSWQMRNADCFSRPNHCLAFIVVPQGEERKLTVTYLQGLHVDHVVLVAECPEMIDVLTQQCGTHREVSVMALNAFEANDDTDVPKYDYCCILQLGDQIEPKSLQFIQRHQEQAGAETCEGVVFDCIDEELISSSSLLRAFPAYKDSYRYTHMPYISRSIWLTKPTIPMYELLARCAKWSPVLLPNEFVHMNLSFRPVCGFRLNQPVSSAVVDPKPDDNVSLPSVTVIIPTRNQVELLRQAVNSVLSQGYPNCDVIIINNQSDQPATLAYLQELTDSQLPITVLDYDAPFNYAAMNNVAADSAGGELLCFLNNDIQQHSEHWLASLVQLAKQSDVGAVGAKLLYPDLSLQHAGVIVGLNGVADHVFKGLDQTRHQQVPELATVRQVSAVTAACLVVKKADFQKVAGFNQQSLSVAFNDVDLCLKLQASGLKNLCDCRVSLIHHESISRGFDNEPEKQRRFAAEKEYMLANWALNRDYNDPCLNPNWLTAVKHQLGA